MQKQGGMIETILCGACFFSCFSQLPYFVTNGMTQRICFPLWILSFLILLINHRQVVSRSILKLAIPAGAFIVLVVVAPIFNIGSSYGSSSLLYSFCVSMFIFFVGNKAGEYYSEKFVNNIFSCYIVGTLIVSVSVFVQYFGFGYDLNTRLYAYASKNSFAQIILTAIILMIIRVKPIRRKSLLIKWGIVAFEVLLMVYLRSRATLVGFIAVVIVLILSKNTRKSLKMLVAGGGSVLIVLLLTNDSVNTMVFNNILFAGRDVSDLDSLTSGRLTILTQFPELIRGHWLFGVGSMYYECFPLSAILQFGLIAGTILIIISGIPLFYGIKNSRKSESWYILMLISLSYVIDSLFEGLTPFGAGIKCFFLWFWFGILISNDSVIEETEEVYYE